MAVSRGDVSTWMSIYGQSIWALFPVSGLLFECPGLPLPASALRSGNR